MMSRVFLIFFSTSRGKTGLMVSDHMEKWGEFTNQWGLQLNSPLLVWFGCWITKLLSCNGPV